jgi:hypothetical protein
LEDLLLPGEEFLDGYYKMLHRYSFRLFLRDIIKMQNFFIGKSSIIFSIRLLESGGMRRSLDPLKISGKEFLKKRTEERC